MTHTQSNFYSSIFFAARPKTLPAAIIPILLGSFLANSLSYESDLILLISILLSAICIQIATNFFNDALDNIKGADTLNRIGPKRISASGELSSQSLIIAGITFCFMAITFSLPIVVARGVPIIIIGLVGLILSYCYTGGPWPLAYKGLGELFVILFFGIVSVTGTFYIFSGELNFHAILLGIQSGLLCSVIIAINNARDIEEDKETGKLTLAARYGIIFAKFEILTLSILPYLIGLFWMNLGFIKTAIIPIIGLPFSLIIALIVMKTKPSKSYNKYLGLSVVAYSNFAILVIISLYYK